MKNNIENGPDIERFGEDFKRDVEKSEALREKLHQESKAEIDQYNSEKTESIKQEHIKAAEEKVASFEEMTEADFSEGSFISYKLSDDKKLAVIKRNFNENYDKLILAWKKDGKVQSKVISNEAYTKMVEMVKNNSEIHGKPSSNFAEYTPMDQNKTNPHPLINYAYEKPYVDGEKVVINFQVLARDTSVLFSEKVTQDINLM